MNPEVLERAFSKIGAKVAFRNLSRFSRQEFSLNVSRDGECFLVETSPAFSVNFSILDIQPADRHLLLMAKYRPFDVRRPDQRGPELKSRFLMGHDERDWFVAAIPESAVGVINVQSAKQALKPAEVQEAEAGIKPKDKHRRHNSARKRQGEWFFVPAPSYAPDPLLILKREPLVRGRSKPHVCDELYRVGGETVYVSRRNPDGVAEAEYHALSDLQRTARGPWRTMRRNPTVYVRGKVRHPDHATLVLDVWHRVYPNTELGARAMANVSFLD